MSPRRRLRTRYEPVVEPAPPAPEPAPAAETPPAPPVEPHPPSTPAVAGAEPPEPVAVAVEPTPEPIGEPAEAFEVPVSHEEAPPVVVEPSRPPRRRMRASLYLALFALLAFVTGMVVFNNVVMPRLIHGVGETTVPDLANLTLEQAEQVLRPLGLQLSRSGERFDPAVPRGFVLSQDPEAGSTVRGRQSISVVVSLGEEFSSVPELFGESMRGARLLIERAGLRVGGIVHAPSDEVGEGLIAASDPGPETVLPRDTPVHLLVSTGARQESFVMPDLLGREIGGVRRQLEALGFRVLAPPGVASLGTIVSQEPPPGSRITRESAIVLQATGRMIR
jgi:serine/threonine-protein kinase